ncbi:UDP-N-acetylglucosamine 1-carboxyvinyltransferase [Patescibacteria group bacterium]
MSKLIVEGVTSGKKLEGEIAVSGSKNASASLIPATILAGGPCRLTNVPNITDVQGLIDILSSMGARVERDGSTVTIDTKDLDPDKINMDLVAKMRMSILMLGALIARFPSVKIPKPGGCKIGARPVGTHFDALEALGTKVEKENGEFVVTKSGRLKGKEFTLDEFSVTATENAILAAVTASETTIVHTAAQEPHIVALCEYLKKMGAKISGVGTHDLKITGVTKLKPADFEVIPDYIEMGTFMCLGAATRGQLVIKNFRPEDIRLELEIFKKLGMKYELKENVCVVKPSKLTAIRKVECRPAPGFAADILPPTVALLTQAEGTTLVMDTMYEGRIQNYVPELVKMGANAVVADPHRAVITGPTPLYGGKTTSVDLRAGATLIIAALMASGRTEIDNAEQINRGYENIVARLRALGASISRED